MKILMIFAFLFVGRLSQAQSLTPGQWHTKTELVLNGLPLPNPNSSECFGPSETRNIKARIVQELGKKGCKLTSWNIRGSNVTASVACANSTFQAKGNLAGEFTLKSYDLRGRAEGTIGFIPSSATVSLQGNWVGACSR